MWFLRNFNRIKHFREGERQTKWGKHTSTHTQLYRCIQPKLPWKRKVQRDSRQRTRWSHYYHSPSSASYWEASDHSTYQPEVLGVIPMQKQVFLSWYYAMTGYHKSPFLKMSCFSLGITLWQVTTHLHFWRHLSSKSSSMVVKSFVQVARFVPLKVWAGAFFSFSCPCN